MRNFIIYLSILFLFSTQIHANDIPTTIIYQPEINQPKDFNNQYLKVHLVVNEKGRVENIVYNKDIPHNIKYQLTPIVKTILLTPYIKNGQKISSLVPYTIRFKKNDQYNPYLDHDE